jgi:hypothetical protein
MEGALSARVTIGSGGSGGSGGSEETATILYIDAQGAGESRRSARPAKETDRRG